MDTSNPIYEYDEPWPGQGPDGSEITCTRTVRISRVDIINYMRLYLFKRHGFCVKDLSDDDLLNEFVAIHWATKCEQDSLPTSPHVALWLDAIRATQREVWRKAGVLVRRYYDTHEQTSPALTACMDLCEQFVKESEAIK